MNACGNTALANVANKEYEEKHILTPFLAINTPLEIVLYQER
jgi:hypothetical protein